MVPRVESVYSSSRFNSLTSSVTAYTEVASPRSRASSSIQPATMLSGETISVHVSMQEAMSIGIRQRTSASKFECPGLYFIANKSLPIQPPIDDQWHLIWQLKVHMQVDCCRCIRQSEVRGKGNLWSVRKLPTSEQEFKFPWIEMIVPICFSCHLESDTALLQVPAEMHQCMANKLTEIKVSQNWGIYKMIQQFFKSVLMPFPPNNWLRRWHSSMIDITLTSLDRFGGILRCWLQ